MLFKLSLLIEQQEPKILRASNCPLFTGGGGKCCTYEGCGVVYGVPP